MAEEERGAQRLLTERMTQTGDVTQPKDLGSALCDLKSSLLHYIGDLEL